LCARYYDPLTGRFNRTDDFAGNNVDPQSLHKYLYAHGNPVNNIDPSGSFSIVLAISVAIVLISLLFVSGHGGTTSPKCGTCGPDITIRMIDLMREVESDFTGLKEHEQKGQCEYAFGWDTGGDAWSIWTLNPHLSQMRRPDGCPSENCRGTVAFRKRCYHAVAANYALFGRIAKLCRVSQLRAEGYIAFHKRIIHGPWYRMDLAETFSWFRWGYEGKHERAPRSTHTHCRTNCPEVVHDLKYWWHPNLKNY